MICELKIIHLRIKRKLSGGGMELLNKSSLVGFKCFENLESNDTLPLGQNM